MEETLRLEARQKAIDTGTYKRKQGRKRHNGHRTTRELQELVDEYLRKVIRKCSTKIYKSNRRDAIFTGLIRDVKKVCYPFVIK